MRVTIRGYQGTGKSRLARQLFESLVKQGRRVRLLDEGVNQTHPKAKSLRAARRGPWDVFIKVVQTTEPIPK